MNIHEALKHARETRGYNKTEFGRLLGASGSKSPGTTVLRYESGERKPGSDIFEKWFAACGCTVSFDGVGYDLKFNKSFSKKTA